MEQCSTGTMDRSSPTYEVDTELMTYVVAKWELICLAAFERINELIRGYVLDMVLEEFKAIILQTLVRYLLSESYKSDVLPGKSPLEPWKRLLGTLEGRSRCYVVWKKPSFVRPIFETSQGILAQRISPMGKCGGLSAFYSTTNILVRPTTRTFTGLSPHLQIAARARSGRPTNFSIHCPCSTTRGGRGTTKSIKVPGRRAKQ